MKLNAKEIIKGVAKFVGSLGVGTLVTVGVNQNILPRNRYESIMCAIGSFVLSGMISAKAEDYIENDCEKIFDTIEQLKGEPVKEIPNVEFKEVTDKKEEE